MKKITNVDINGRTYAVALIAGAIIYEIVKWFGWVDIYSMIALPLLSLFIMFESCTVSKRLYKGFKYGLWEVTLHTNRKLDTFMRWVWIVFGVLFLLEATLLENIIGVGLLYTSVATFYLKNKCEK